MRNAFSIALLLVIAALAVAACGGGGSGDGEKPTVPSGAVAVVGDQTITQEQFDQLRKLRFFHDFSHSEIWEVLRASEWCSYAKDDEIIREGEMDDRFYIIVNGTVSVQSSRRHIGELGQGNCFGETSYVRGARRTATIKANVPVTLVRVSSTLLEQASSACQLRFNKVFLRSLIERLQGVASPAT